ncbi:MAG: membrane protein [Rhodomicrobium sp.]|nr:MAG: membrane protein [Rhodomicrobium sp.]
MSYLFIKYIHIIGAAVLFGTGMGIAFFLFAGMRLCHQGETADERAALSVLCRLVVIADIVFTAVAAIVQPITGAALVMMMGYEFSDLWVALSLGLYVFIGLCWLPVVKMQNEMSRISQAAVAAGQAFPPRFHLLYRRWFLLGWPAFGAMLVIFGLMVYRPDASPW